MRLDQITIHPILPGELIALLFVLGFFAVAIQFWIYRKKFGSLKALGLSLLRMTALLLIASFALNPSVVKREERKVMPTVAVIVDTSKTMGLPGAAGKGSRLDEAKSILRDLKSMPGGYDISLYSLGESLRVLEPGELEKSRAGEKRGDLTEALKQLRERNAVGVFLSDGNMRWENGLSTELKTGLSTELKTGNSTDLPVITLPLGDPQGYRDLLIKAVKAPAIVFRGREATIDVTVKGYGYSGSTLPVLLKEGNKLLTAKSIRLNGSPSESTVSLPFTIEEIGAHHLSVSISPQVGESLVTNNSVDFSLNVLRDKIRILMASGSPSMSYRFMRAAFKNDPSIDLLSFVILRTPSDTINVPLQEQSLIPFPVETLFTKELKNFDLVIFDNLPSHLYLKPAYLDTIRDFVRGGGGFAMIGGPHLLDDGRYAGTAIGEVLPVRLTEKEDYRRDSPSGVKLSRAGRVHPITRFTLTDSGAKADRPDLWREMPELDGINQLTPKSSATVLLEGANGDSPPILTVGSYGKGRVLVLASDYSWKWDMGMVAKGRGNWVYLRLMERMIRWLTKDVSLEPLQVTFPERLGGPGEEIDLRIKSGEEGLSQDVKRGISLSILGPDRTKIPSQVKTTGQAGEYLGVFIPEKEGTYRLKVETQGSSLEESVLVTGRMEGQDAFPDHQRLKTLSASTGGKFLSGREDLLNEIVNYTKKVENRFTEERRIPIWNSMYLLIVIVLCLAIEWYYRRRWGLM